MTALELFHREGSSYYYISLGAQSCSPGHCAHGLMTKIIVIEGRQILKIKKLVKRREKGKKASRQREGNQRAF